MKFSKDYEIISEEKHYAVFKDGSGVEQKVEIDEKLADMLENLQRDESSSERYNRMQTFSLDSLGYEGEVFATYDDCQLDKEQTIEEKVRIVLKQMKPKQAKLLYEIIFMNKKQEEIAAEEKVTQGAISHRFSVCKENFKKISKKIFPKTSYFGSFFS